MTKARSLQDAIVETEYLLAKYKFVLSKFPDAKLHNSYYLGFSSKMVNKNYTKFDFVKGYNSLYVAPYCEIMFDHNGKTEAVRVNSSPRTSRLVYLSHRIVDNKRIMKFSKLAFNLKNNDFKDNMLNDCRVQIMQFIQHNPNCKLDTKHMEPRLKKLLLFT